jgi:hypothetical protein
VAFRKWHQKLGIYFAPCLLAPNQPNLCSHYSWKVPYRSVVLLVSGSSYTVSFANIPSLTALTISLHSLSEMLTERSTYRIQPLKRNHRVLVRFGIPGFLIIVFGIFSWKNFPSGNVESVSAHLSYFYSRPGTYTN